MSWLRGEKGIAPEPGSRRLRSTELHDDETRASCASSEIAYARYGGACHSVVASAHGWLPIEKLHPGATRLRFKMDRQPNKERGAAIADRPHPSTDNQSEAWLLFHPAVLGG